MTNHKVYFSSDGGVVLGPVVCDGFFLGAPIRVQTHVHEDHMAGFQSSKGFQTVVMSKATKALLELEFDAELPYRANLVALDTGHVYKMQEADIQLLPSEHMLGAVQVVVTMPDGSRLGYSGDFNWPLETVAQADILVVDSTYGSPNYSRMYTRGHVDERFVHLVTEHLRHGAVHVKAHRGTLQKALQLLNGVVQTPVVAPLEVCKEVDVYRRFGYQVAPVLCLESSDGKHAISCGQYIRLYGRGEGNLFGLDSGTAINLSAYMSDPKDPVLEHYPNSYTVAMSCHASFEETIEYVRASGAIRVITYHILGSHVDELARELRARLGIEAGPAYAGSTHSWGE